MHDGNGWVQSLRVANPGNDEVLSLAEVSVLSMNYPLFHASMITAIASLALLVVGDTLRVFGSKSFDAPVVDGRSIQEHPLYESARESPAGLAAIREDLHRAAIDELLRHGRRAERLQWWHLNCRIWGHLGLLFTAICVFIALSTHYFDMHVVVS